MLGALALAGLVLCAAPSKEGSPPRPQAKAPQAAGKAPAKAVEKPAKKPPEERPADEGSAPALPKAVEPLAAAALRTDAMRVDGDGELSIEAVRRRLGALASLAGMAKAHLRSPDVEARLAAHLVVAASHMAFASELLSARTPRAARGEASSAFKDQLDETARRALLVSAANLRSCRELARTSGLGAGLGRACQERLAQVPAEVAGSLPAKASPKEAIRARLPELQPCFDEWASAHPAADPIRLQARISLDGLGRVEDVSLSPPAEYPALYECVSDGLWLWVFPGLEDSEIELPIKVAGGSR